MNSVTPGESCKRCVCTSAKRSYCRRNTMAPVTCTEVSTTHASGDAKSVFSSLAAIVPIIG
jgi:hypothetical protein